MTGIDRIRINLGSPQATQKALFQARSRFVAFGGARGGGKSWAVRGKALRMAFKHAGIKILIIRKTYNELWENHILPILNIIGGSGAAKYRDTHKTIRFHNGARIIFGYFASDSDALRYQGQEYDVIFIDEATQFTEFVFNILKACLRGANRLPKRMYLTCNPGGVGHMWVKRLFVTKNYLPHEDANDYSFIKSQVYDNKKLLDSDPGYIKMLQSLPDKIRSAWLDGNWDVFEGQYFPEFSQERHAVAPFDVPREWKRYTTMDYGLDMLAWYDVAIDGNGNCYVVNEIYKQNLIVSEAVKEIRSAEIINRVKVAARLAPPDLWNRQPMAGKSTALLFSEYGMELTKTNNDRIAGWLAVKELLKDIRQVDGSYAPKLRIFSTCKNLIRSISELQYDSKKINDVATEPHEITHAPDALRGFAIYWATPANPENTKRIKYDKFMIEEYLKADEAGKADIIKAMGGRPIL